MDQIIRNSIYKCTTGSFWVCLIDGRVMVGRGSHASGKCAWRRKCDCVQAFKNSHFWLTIKSSLRNQHPEIPNWQWVGRGSGEAKKLYDEAYVNLLMDGTIKFIEVSKTPDWLY